MSGRLLGVIWVIAVVSACEPPATPRALQPQAVEEDQPLSNRIAIPARVRSNLGMTFATVEARRVTATLRVPGMFELEPTARQEIHTTLSGRVELVVRQYQRVDAGTTLCWLDSPQWRETQAKLVESQQEIHLCIVREQGLSRRLLSTSAHEQKLAALVRIWAERLVELQQLIQAGSGAGSELAEARSQLATAEAGLAEVVEERSELESQLLECQANLAGYRRKMPLLFADLTQQAVADVQALDLALTPAAALLGVTVAALRRNVGTEQAPVAWWQTLDRIEIKAPTAGVVESLAVSPGAWVEPSALLLTLVDPHAVRFRAIALQSDLALLTAGLPVSVVPPRGGVRTLAGAMPGVLELGLEADPVQRRLDLLTSIARAELLPWARPGVAAEMEIAIAGGELALAIPLTAVVRDGLQHVFFRRDPRDPDKAIRIEADLGADDGRWVVVKSGIKGGDQVVDQGAYELVLTGAGADRQGGHFHADGTFHKGEH
jgi:multidrug resistance efflux pump